MRDLLPKIDRFAEIGSLAQSVRHILGKGFGLLLAATATGQGYLVYTGHPGAVAFSLIGAGCLIVLGVWRNHGVGLPVVPMLAIQTLVAYGLPLINNNQDILAYTPADMTTAGLEVFLYCVSIALAWKLGIRTFTDSSPECYAIRGFEQESMTILSRLGFGLVGAATSFEILRSLELLDAFLAMLPSGSNSIIQSVLAAVGACGFFLCGMIVGRGGVGSTARILFWSLLAINCFISASGFLLSSMITVVFSAVIGLFWGSGRIPWRFVLALLALLSFLNLGKATMRSRYWYQEDSENITQFTLSQMPARYAEWFDASIEATTPPPQTSFGKVKKEKGSQSLADRVNNLQNILYVIDAVERGGISPLGGATYTLIPPLLVPRIFWPDKPRTHEGQILLNVHFGRQDLNSTVKTYVAWGLLAEAYGNFGPITGAILLGGGIGIFFAWVERRGARKLLLSMEGFITFTVFLGMANSFEMVASVLITSIFQACLTVGLASLPFTERVTPHQPTVLR